MPKGAGTLKGCWRMLPKSPQHRRPRKSRSPALASLISRPIRADNFKVLQEKKAHVLVDADFALWQESENQWNMRLEARPTRTDANLDDTGTLRIEGSFQRADRLESTPMKLSFDWQKSQLGQLTTLIYGRDRGWRGDVHVSGTVEGMPQRFAAKATARIYDFRRYDIAGDDAVFLTANCTADHSSMPSGGASGHRNSFQCVVPLSPGNIELRALGEYWWHSPSYVSVRANGVPAAALLQVYRHAKLDVPRDLAGEGMLNAYFSRVNFPDSDHPRWIGQGVLTNLNVSSASLGETFRVPSARFGFSQVEQLPEGPGSAGLTPRLQVAKKARIPVASPSNIFTIDSVTANVGGAKPLVISGTDSADGLHLDVKGDADVKDVSAAAQMFGLHLPPAVPVAGGIASVEYSITTHWTGFAAPVVTGTLRAAPHTSTRATETASNQHHAKTTRQRE